MLTNVEIKTLIANNTLVIKGYDSNMLQPASYDMRIGTIFRDGKIINQAHPLANDPITIAPGEVITMLTLEELELPDNIAATAYAMNDRSSEGLLVLNPGHVDPGYKGPLTVVALNLRSVPLVLQLEATIFTVVFERLTSSSSPAYQSPNSVRRDVERETNRKVVEKSIGSLKKLLSITKEDIKQLIVDHWMSKAVTGATIVGMVAAVIAAVFAITGPSDYLKRDQPKIADQPAKIADQPSISGNQEPRNNPSPLSIPQSGAAASPNVAKPTLKEKECTKPNC